VLRPAGRRLILAELEKGNELAALAQAAELASQLRMADLIDQTLKPLLQRHAAALLESRPDAGQLQQVFETAQALGMSDVINDAVKPAFRRLCRAARNHKPDAATLQTALNLARSLQCKDAMPLALHGAFARELSAQERSSAILFVGEFGDKTEVGRLEGLLKETAGCGAGGFDSTSISTQLGDVALAVLVFRSGQSLAEYGFPFFEIFPGAVPFEHGSGLLGFAGAADREAAQKKWRAFAAKNRG
jgi:hypothetical protein